MKKPSVSIIIPTLNEENGLATTLRSVLSENVEVIVVDGGSDDRTCRVAEEMGVLVLHAKPSRGAQMNLGAERASGDILLFLHADTRLPEQYLEAMLYCLNQPETSVGAFRLRLWGKRRGMALISWGANLRSKWFGLVYGDQGLFMAKELFFAVGCFPEMAIMEDFILVQKLRRRGRVRLASGEVLSSARRWDRHGLWYPSLVNQLIILGFYLGLSPKILAKLYGVRQKV